MPSNRLLDKLSKQERQSIEASLEEVELPQKKVLYEPGAPITVVYFIIEGVVSMVNEPEPGEVVEFATIGPEGMAGVRIWIEPRRVR